MTAPKVAPKFAVGDRVRAELKPEPWLTHSDERVVDRYIYTVTRSGRGRIALDGGEAMWSADLFAAAPK